MNKKLLLTFASALVILSCRKDDDSIQTPEQQLVGTWKTIKTVKISGKDNSIISTTNASGCSASDTFQFTSDKKIIFKLHAVPSESSTCSLVETATGTYSYNSTSKNITIAYLGDYTENINIYSLNNSELVTFEALDRDYNGDGINDNELTYQNKQ